MNAKNLRTGVIATALLTLSTLASPALADVLQDHRSQWRQDSREIHQVRRELRHDYRELARDRADYRHAKAHGDIFGMFRERMEIRQDKREIRHDRAALRHDLHDRRQHVRGHQHRGHNWGGQRAVRHDSRPEAAPRQQAKAGNRQEARQQSASSPSRSQPATAQRNNGRHLGWEQGQGNPHRG